MRAITLLMILFKLYLHNQHIILAKTPARNKRPKLTVKDNKARRTFTQKKQWSANEQYLPF